MQPCRGKYCDERWAQLHPGCIARAAPDKGMNMQRRWDNHRWNYTAFLLTGFDCSISSCLQNPTESASWLGFSLLPLRSLVAPCHLSVPWGCSQARSSRSASQGWCMRDALAPGGGNIIFPWIMGIPVLTPHCSEPRSSNPSPQPGPSPAQVSICIQSPFPWRRGDAPTASIHCWVSSSPLLSALSWSIPAHPMLSQLPTHQGEKLRFSS